MKEIGSYQAKTHLPSLLEKVRKGEKFIITRHGNPIAQLIPAGSSPETPVSEVIAEIREFSKGRKLGSLSIKTLRETGRK